MEKRNSSGDLGTWRYNRHDSPNVQMSDLILVNWGSSPQLQQSSFGRSKMPSVTDLKQNDRAPIKNAVLNRAIATQRIRNSRAMSVAERTHHLQPILQ